MWSEDDGSASPTPSRESADSPTPSHESAGSPTSVCSGEDILNEMKPLVPANPPRIDINDLPLELVREILRLVDDVNDRLSFMLVQRSWYRLALAALWVRPALATEAALTAISRQLAGPSAANATLIRRLNLSGVSSYLSDGVVEPFTRCDRLERLVVNGASLSESLLARLVYNNVSTLHNVDLLDIDVGDALCASLSDCTDLTSLCITGSLTDQGAAKIASGCKQLRRVKLGGCPLLTRFGIMALVGNCSQITDFDLSQLAWAQPASSPEYQEIQRRSLRNEDVASMLRSLPFLRDLKLDGNVRLDARAFSGSPRLDSIRLLSLAMCPLISDAAIDDICATMPRLRHLVLNKCPELSDRAVRTVARRYGAQLQYIHLGHCPRLTDAGVAELASWCQRLHFVDLAGCYYLTNDAVVHLAHLPRLRRIGLVKCNQIDDTGIYALATRRVGDENTLERVHLSYCVNLSSNAICALLNACPRLSHLSLTGVNAFLRADLRQFCRDMPQDLSQHQQQMFCVYSGQGVQRLRAYLNRETALILDEVNMDTDSDGEFDEYFSRVAVHMQNVADAAVE